MPRIRQLDRQVAELIAAGEVVERPASVIKELVENAIDAGAAHITVEVENGGMARIRVTDDGCGIARDDVEIAFSRHATSKIEKAEDLFEIRSLGFRGEALAATAAVSRIDMLTCPAGHTVGTHIRLEGGAVREKEEAGCPVGTTIVVRDLFFNTPARLKFMKRDATEAGYAAGVVMRAALSAPDISFTFLKNGVREFHTPGDGKLASVVYALYGREYAASLLPVSAEPEGVSVSGLVTRPENPRKNRSMQDFFVNGRYVRSRIMGAALEEAYKERITVGCFPGCFLFLKISPLSVDVNIHPAKTEVKFMNDKRVFDGVFMAVKTALDGDLSRPAAWFVPKMGVQPGARFRSRDQERVPSDVAGAPTGAPDDLPSRTDGVQSLGDPPAAGGAGYAVPIRKKGGVLITGPSEAETGLFADGTSAFAAPPRPDRTIVYRPERAANRERPGTGESRSPDEPSDRADSFRGASTNNRAVAQGERRLEGGSVPQEASETFSTGAEEPRLAEGPGYRVVGELFTTYLLVEEGDDFILIDKHAAHERLRFNELMERGADPCPQLFLSPVTVTLSPEEKEVLAENRETLQKVGFELEEFGVNTLLVRSMPAYLTEAELVPTLSELAETLKNGRLSQPERFVQIVEKISCTGAIKAGGFTSERERDDFVQKVMSMPEVKFCPHGRPVAVRMSRHQLEKQFKRS